MATGWKESDVRDDEDSPACVMWHSACAALNAPDPGAAWRQILDASSKDRIWHSLRNCVNYQAVVWQRLLCEGIADAAQPAAFQLALVLRHTHSELVVKLLGELLNTHPQNRDLTSYILSLLTEDEVRGMNCPSPPPGAEPAPRRDLRLFSDCELAVLAAAGAEYGRHAALLRAECAAAGLDGDAYHHLRIKILDQLCKIPKLFHSPEFEPLEAIAKENIQREIRNLKQNDENAMKP